MSGLRLGALYIKMILVFCGDGKGKTTSAIGQGIRALGQKKKVAMLQFIKSSKFPSGEDQILSQLGEDFFYYKGGRGFVGIMGDRLPFFEHSRAAQDTLEKARRIIASQKFDLVILDEINVALKLGLLSKKEVLEVLASAAEKTDLILTGRGAPKKLIDLADLVTNFEDVKHPFQKKVPAKKGIEY